MNYTRIYNELIQRGINRKILEGYSEKHHIIPICIGGSNKKDNLVKLTAREHFIAHWLLVRIYPVIPGIAYAFYMMCKVKDKNQKRYVISKSSNAYAEARELNSNFRKGSKRPDRLSGINHPMYGKTGALHPNFGKKLPKEQVEKWLLSRKDYKPSFKTKEKISKTLSYGGCYKAKPVTCHTTGKKFSCGKELAEFLTLPYGTVRRYLNLYTPINFRYSYDQ